MMRRENPVQIDGRRWGVQPGKDSEGRILWKTNCKEKEQYKKLCQHNHV
jgi:hypothetical protein